MEEPHLEIEKRADARTLHGMVVDDIANVKNRQWQITNYALLLYVGIVGVAGVISSSNSANSESSPLLPWFLSALTVVIFIVNCCQILLWQNDLRHHRRRLEYLRSHFDRELVRGFPQKEEVTKDPNLKTSFKYGFGDVVAPLLGSSVIAMVITWVIVFNSLN